MIPDGGLLFLAALLIGVGFLIGLIIILSLPKHGGLMEGRDVGNAVAEATWRLSLRGWRVRPGPGGGSLKVVKDANVAVNIHFKPVDGGVALSYTPAAASGPWLVASFFDGAGITLHSQSMEFAERDVLPMLLGPRAR